jgi:hypothetical protein
VIKIRGKIIFEIYISIRKIKIKQQSLIGFAKMDFLEIISHRRRNVACDEKSILSYAYRGFDKATSK